jgi:hypothetical protein
VAADLTDVAAEEGITALDITDPAACERVFKTPMPSSTSPPYPIPRPRGTGYFRPM